MKIIFCLIPIVLYSRLFAVPLIDEPVKEVKLSTGKVLIDAQVRGYASKAVLVKHRDGAETIPYDQFPKDVRGVLLAHKPVDTTPTQNPAPYVKPKPAGTPRPERARDITGLAWNNLRIGGVTPNGQMARVEVVNESDKPEEFYPSSFVIRSDEEKSYEPKQFVGLDSRGNVAATLDRTQTLSVGERREIVLIGPIPPGKTIKAVSWKSPMR